MQKAQGTIEYLVIIAIVVVISLVVTGMLTGFFNSSSSTIDASLKIKTQTSIVAITDAAINPDGNYVLVLKNNDSDEFTIKTITINGNLDSPNEKIVTGSQKTIQITGTDQTCIEGQIHTATVEIVYETKYGLEKTITHELQIDCSNFTINPINTTPEPIPVDPPAILLSSPTNTHQEGDGIVTFSYDLTNSANNCYLLINNSVIETNQNPIEGTNTFSNINISSFSLDTNYLWDINCDNADQNYSSTNGDFNILYPSFYLSSSSTGLFSSDENLIANINPSYNPQNSYIWNWFKNDDLNATNLINDSRLKAYFPLDNDIKNYSITQDSSILITPTPNVDGRIGKAYHFGGDTNGALIIPTTWSGTLNTLLGHGKSTNYGGTTNTTGHTISLWFKLSEPVNSTDTDIRYIFRGGNGVWLSFNKGYGNTVPGSLIFSQHYYWYGNTTNHALTSARTWPADNWNHLVATWDLSNLRLYVNGVLEDTTPMTLAPQDWWGPPDLSIGANSNGFDPLNGVIDEFSVYGQALNQEEISQLYYGGLNDGNNLDSSLLTTGDEWKVGYQSNYNDQGWNPDINSQPVTIT